MLCVANSLAQSRVSPRETREKCISRLCVCQADVVVQLAAERLGTEPTIPKDCISHFGALMFYEAILVHFEMRKLIGGAAPIGKGQTEYLYQLLEHVAPASVRCSETAIQSFILKLR